MGVGQGQQRGDNEASQPGFHSPTVMPTKKTNADRWWSSTKQRRFRRTESRGFDRNQGCDDGGCQIKRRRYKGVDQGTPTRGALFMALPVRDDCALVSSDESDGLCGFCLAAKLNNSLPESTRLFS